jgi:hypothetical protein
MFSQIVVIKLKDDLSIFSLINITRLILSDLDPFRYFYLL